MIKNRSKPASFLLSAIVAVCFGSLFSAQTLHADTVYKSVDESGKTTYSSTPPADKNESSVVDIAPPPSQEHVEAARQRHEKNQKAAEILDENRKARDQITAEENRIKRERQKQAEQKKQADNTNRNDQYGYYPYNYRRGTGIIGNPKPPVEHLPVQLPIHH